MGSSLNNRLAPPFRMLPVLERWVWLRPVLVFLREVFSEVTSPYGPSSHKWMNCLSMVT